jgi:hypothetical protein
LGQNALLLTSLESGKEELLSYIDKLNQEVLRITVNFKKLIYTNKKSQNFNQFWDFFNCKSALFGQLNFSAK